VYNGEDTIAAARAWQPDLILLDVMMPKMSGFEVCRRLRSDPATKDVAVLMVTALDQANDVETAVETGTDDFLTKPINKTELLLRVRAMLESRDKPDELERELAYIGRVQAGL
jgi:DNA-binding response OmpR family regulator